MSRWSRIAGEAGRFMAVGAVSTLVAVLLYNWLAYAPQHLWSPLHRHITLSYVVSHAVGMLVSYELSRRWTFKERSDRKAGEGFLSYAVINILTMVTIPVACLWLSRHWLGYTSGLADNLSGNVVGLLISQVARFYLFRRFVFKRPIHYIEVYDDPHELALSETEPGSWDERRDGSTAPSTSDRVS